MPISQKVEKWSQKEELYIYRIACLYESLSRGECDHKFSFSICNLAALIEMFRFVNINPLQDKNIK